MPPAQYQPGQVLPGTVYRVVRHLATGGMGSVYDVEDVTVEKRYVLKTLHPNLVAREDLALRMRDEARSLAKLQHPNIVDVVTAGVTSDAQKMPFYVMERLIGQNLRVVLEKTGGLHPLHAYRIAIDLGDALEHAHENNIVHRDVKPENIFLHRNANGTTTTKLLDFGIVRLLDRKASHTQGKFIGTLRYASPEQIKGKKVGPPTDIYSLGLVLFEMLCGRGPFDEAGDAYAIGAAHASEPAPPLSRFASVTPEVERLVASALAKEPELRPRDCFTFASELRRILRNEEASPRSATAANILSAAPPPTPARSAETATAGATHEGMLAPSAVASAEPPVLSVPPTTRPDRAAAPVSPIAPTLAAAGISYEPNGGRGRAPAAPPPAAGRPIDRNAPTRNSAPFGETRRLAQNDTRMDADAIATDDVVRDAFGESVSLVVPPLAGAAQSANEMLFPPMQTGAGTGPISAEAHTRAPERGPYILLAAAAFIAVVLIGGPLLAVKRPWEKRVETHAPEPSASTVHSVASPAVAPPASHPTALATATPAEAPGMASVLGREPASSAPRAIRPPALPAPSAAQPVTAVSTPKVAAAPPAARPAKPAADKPRSVPSPSDVVFSP